jgi:hypothetical protein
MQNTSAPQDRPKFNYLLSRCRHEDLVTEVRLEAAPDSAATIVILVIIVFATAYALRMILKF